MRCVLSNKTRFQASFVLQSSYSGMLQEQTSTDSLEHQSQWCATALVSLLFWGIHSSAAGAKGGPGVSLMAVLDIPVCERHSCSPREGPKQPGRKHLQMDLQTNGAPTMIPFGLNVLFTRINSVYIAEALSGTKAVKACCPLPARISVTCLKSDMRNRLRAGKMTCVS